jgi:hypothetical protein
VFGIGWKDAEATIVDRRLLAQSTEPAMGEFASQSVRTYEYIADVRPADGSQPFRAVVHEPFNAITFKAPEVGQVVRVKYNHKERDEHKVKFDRSDPGTYENVPGVPDWRHHGNPLKDADKKAVANAHSSEAQAAWDAALNAPPGSHTTTDSQLAADRELAAHDPELQELLDLEESERSQRSDS